MGGRSSVSRVLASIAITAGLLVGPATVASAAPAPESATGATIVPMAQKYYWIWSDDSEDTSRTFKKSKYHNQAGLPHLIITVEPADPARTIYLQFKQKGKWILENKVKTDSDGKATIELNPYCTNDTWCDGTWTYRLKAGDRYQNLKITYSET